VEVSEALGTTQAIAQGPHAVHPTFQRWLEQWELRDAIKQVVWGYHRNS
jgi:hypothetical protein